MPTGDWRSLVARLLQHFMRNRLWAPATNPEGGEPGKGPPAGVLGWLARHLLKRNWVLHGGVELGQEAGWPWATVHLVDGGEKGQLKAEAAMAAPLITSQGARRQGKCHSRFPSFFPKSGTRGRVWLQSCLSILDLLRERRTRFFQQAP